MDWEKVISESKRKILWGLNLSMKLNPLHWVFPLLQSRRKEIQDKLDQAVDKGATESTYDLSTGIQTNYFDIEERKMKQTEDNGQLVINGKTFPVILQTKYGLNPHSRENGGIRYGRWVQVWNAIQGDEEFSQAELSSMQFHFLYAFEEIIRGLEKAKGHIPIPEGDMQRFPHWRIRGFWFKTAYYLPEAFVYAGRSYDFEVEFNGTTVNNRCTVGYYFERKPLEHGNFPFEARGQDLTEAVKHLYGICSQYVNYSKVRSVGKQIAKPPSR